jgi:hypothetical protein
MTTEYHHHGKGCDYIERITGNELTTPEVHFYYCKRPPTFEVYFQYGDFKKQACSEHAMMWAQRYKVTTKLIEVKE